MRLTIILVAHVELPVSLLTPPSAQNPAAAPSTSSAPPPTSSLTKEKKRKHHLTTATDPLFAELRDLNFSAVGRKLNQVARRLDEDYKVGCAGRLMYTRLECVLTSLQLRHQAKTVAQLRDFVGKLGGLQTEHQALRLRKFHIACTDTLRA